GRKPEWSTTPPQRWTPDNSSFEPPENHGVSIYHRRRAGVLPGAYWITENAPFSRAGVANGSTWRGGTCKSGIGLPWKSLRQGTASQRAHWFARLRRALSVAIPVLAYICR